jgi:hypothetical protein
MEADDAEVAGVHGQHQPGGRGRASTSRRGALVVPTSPAAPESHDVRQAEAAADLDQLAPRHDDLAPRGQRGQASSSAAALLLTTVAAGAGQRRRSGSRRVSRAARPRPGRSSTVKPAASRRARRRGRERGAPQPGVQEDARALTARG